MSVLSKVAYTLRHEGVRSLVNRGARYAAYRTRRLVMDKTEAFRDWERLKNTYSGRAFLIGNGPSLNLTPLYLLEGQPTMCFNRFDLMLERVAWTPTFYTVIDDRVLLDTLREVNDMSGLAEHSFFPDIHPYNVDFRRRIEKRDTVHWLHLDGTTFSDRLPRCGINKTVANVGLQILAYLGFTEIYLIGLDMTYSIPRTAIIENARDITSTEDDDESHFDPRYFGKGRSFHVPMLDETFSRFREARRFFDARGVRIVNATAGGVLEEFPRASLEDVIGYDRARRLEMFTDTVRKRSGSTVDVAVALAAAPQPGSPADIDSSWNAFRVPAAKANAFIMKAVFDFIPFGPCEGVYLFVRRAPGPA